MKPPVIERYKARKKLKVKIGNLTKKLDFLGKFIFFTQSLGRVQLRKTSLNSILFILKEQAKNLHWSFSFSKVISQQRQRLIVDEYQIIAFYHIILLTS